MRSRHRARVSTLGAEEEHTIIDFKVLGFGCNCTTTTDNIASSCNPQEVHLPRSGRLNARCIACKSNILLAWIALTGPGLLHACKTMHVYKHAGIAYKGNVFGAEEARNTMATNFSGTRAVCERLERLVPEGGRIVNVCSLAGKLSILRSPELRARFEKASTAEDVANLSEEFLQAVADGRWGSVIYI